MEIPAQVLYQLRQASYSLASTGPLYNGIEGLDKVAMLKKLGLALSTISEIDESICNLQPELIADQWKLINQDKEAYDAERKKLHDAMEAEESGNFELAKKLFHEIETSSKIQDYRIKAQAGLYRINAAS
jgi:hypothetical protein